MYIRVNSGMIDLNREVSATCKHNPANRKPGTSLERACTGTSAWSYEEETH